MTANNKKTLSKIALAGWIYLGWFGCVYCGKMNWGWGSLGFPAVSWILLGLTLQWSVALTLRLLVLMISGLAFDSFAAHFSWLQFDPSPSFGWLPLWMTSLWALFVSSLPLLQTALQKRYFLAALLGGVLGPLSYWAGGKYASLTMQGPLTLSIYVLFWASYLPGSMYVLRPQERPLIKWR